MRLSDINYIWPVSLNISHSLTTRLALLFAAYVCPFPVALPLSLCPEQVVEDTFIKQPQFFARPPDMLMR